MCLVCGVFCAPTDSLVDANVLDCSSLLNGLTLIPIGSTVTYDGESCGEGQCCGEGESCGDGQSYCE